MKLSSASTVVEKAILFNASLSPELFQGYILPHLEGPPGIGKTSIVHQVAKKLNATVNVLNLADREPSDILGWRVPNADGTEMKHVSPEWLANLGDGLNIVFIDEIRQGSTAAQNVTSQILNERMVGSLKVPDNVFFVTASNRAKDRAGTNHMPTHLRDRMTFIEVHPDVDDTVSHFSERGVDPRLCAYLRFRGIEMLSNFDPDADACPSPRSWERVNSIMQFDMEPALKEMTIGGQVGDGAAADFTGYLRVAANIPDIDHLIKNPTKADVPHDRGVLYALCSALSSRMDMSNVENIMTYVYRIDADEMKAVVFADALRRDPKLRQSKHMIKAMSEFALRNAT
jgi:hypothetical protein